MAHFLVKASAYAAIEAKYACAHETRELRLRTIKDGRKAYYRQCVVCGHAGSAVSRKSAEAELQNDAAPPFDNNLEHYWRGRKHAEYISTYRQIAPKLHAEYEEYLKSEAWAQHRTVTIRRAGGICECCEHFPATQVHHLTYERIGRESDTDLMAVCTFCHELLHGKIAL